MEMGFLNIKLNCEIFVKSVKIFFTKINLGRNVGIKHMDNFYGILICFSLFNKTNN